MSDSSFGLRIGLEGEREFKKAIADINRSMRVLGSELKLVASQFGKNESSAAVLTAKNQVLAKQIDTQRNKIATLKQSLENAANAFGESDSRTKNWQIQLNNAEATLNDLERELGANENAIEGFNSEAAESEHDLKKRRERRRQARGVRWMSLGKSWMRLGARPLTSETYSKPTSHLKRLLVRSRQSAQLLKVSVGRWCRVRRMVWDITRR